MKAIAHLKATAIKPDVLEWAISKPCIDPVTEDPLIGSPELPRAGKDPQRLIQTAKSNAAPYSSASDSEASFVLP